MLTEIGLISLGLAALLTLYALGAALAGTRRNDGELSLIHI